MDEGHAGHRVTAEQGAEAFLEQCTVLGCCARSVCILPTGMRTILLAGNPAWHAIAHVLKAFCIMSSCILLAHVCKSFQGVGPLGIQLAHLSVFCSLGLPTQSCSVARCIFLRRVTLILHLQHPASKHDVHQKVHLTSLILARLFDLIP